jgi:hypothetical protein
MPQGVKAQRSFSGIVSGLKSPTYRFVPHGWVFWMSFSRLDWLGNRRHENRNGRHSGRMANGKFIKRLQSVCPAALLC